MSASTDLSPLLSWLVANTGRDVEVRLNVPAFVMSGRLLRVEQRAHDDGDVLVVYFGAEERAGGARAALRIESDATLVALGAAADEDPADDFIAFRSGVDGVSVQLHAPGDEAA